MPDGTYALRMRFSAYRYSLAIRQEVCAVMALNMLRRWLNGEDITSEHGWIDVVPVFIRKISFSHNPD
ncbi:molybdopterin-binding protein [Salmonella enterica]|uniref:molybdopterin-binding protein n=1 Tax=Salmonella enterica TaxID=28901 RepID=UPI000DA8D8D7|nr:molybdopterin-binding protein [Salmonella enterica]PZM30501.1 molybdopterin-binding protein [Salmonella enterica subsp. enterica serovar Derby]